MITIWKRWIVISKRISVLLADIALTIVYFALIVPFGILLKLFFRHTLLGHIHHTRSNSFWVKRDKTTYDIKWAKEQ